MFSPPKIEDCYKSLASLYRNPTRHLAELAATNVDEALIEGQQELLRLFLEAKADLKAVDPSLYFKTLALLYEIDDYRGAESKVQESIEREGSALLADIRRAKAGVREFSTPTPAHPRMLSRNAEGSSRRETFTRPYNRSYWKARVICCVAMVESGRRGRRHDGYGQKHQEKSLDELASDLDVLESFVEDHLHNKHGKLFAWTTLAFVQSAQARIARQGQDYRLAEHKLLKATKCLDGRAEEIRQIALSKLSAKEPIEELKDDLVSIRRKQTLISFFIVALAAVQRGFLRTANRACQSARLQFRLHGHNYHAIFNDLIILSIKRARTSRENYKKFETLEAQLQHEIIRRVRPEPDHPSTGNSKLYLYALRELALLQSYRKKTGPMLATLELMEQESGSHERWQSRIYHQRARAFWIMGREQEDAAHFQRALEYLDTAFKKGSGLDKTIESYRNSRTLKEDIKRSKRTNIIETIESLITYGSIQASARNFDEAIKTADAIIQYCDETNPRLLAMGYLIRAEAYLETDRVLEAKQDVAEARILQRRIDHKYVADRMRDIEQHWLKREDYIPLADLRRDRKLWKNARARLMGWLIENHTDKESPTEIEEHVGISRRTVRIYLQSLKQNEGDPYHPLAQILRKSKISGERQPEKKEVPANDSEPHDAEA